MKKIFKNTLFIILLIFSIIFIPNNVNAISTEYKNINEEIISLNDNNSSFQFTKVNFKNWSNSQYPTFGLSGIVYNGNSYDVSFFATATYYDSNYNVIATTYDNQFVPAGEYNSYSHMSNLSEIKSGYTANDIVYYKLDVEINKKGTTNNNSSTTIPSKNNKYKSYEYVIDKYNVDIIVNENNTFDITETITAYFNVSKHGIFRTIPLKNTITRLDGTTSKNRAQISNLSVNNKYKTSRENGNYKIKIGSANHTLTGEQTYVIKYTYNIGKDPVKNHDELYYNIIGNEWDTVIGNVTFSITMPKEFDLSKLGFSSGAIGSADNSKVKYNVNGNKITGSYNGILEVGEALTIRCELPEGYFVGAGLSTNSIVYIMFLIPILFLGIAIFLWYKFGRDDQVVETVEFYPPEGFNSLEVGFLYKGKAKNKDITSLLIFLANKGYLEITNKKIDLNSKKVNLNQDSKNSASKKIIELQNKINEEKTNNPNSKKIKYYENMLDIYKHIDTPINYEQYGLKSSINILNNENNFLIKKLKNYDGTNVNEQLFMNGLFEYDRTEVTDKMLYNNFYITNKRILSNINNKENKNKIFEKSASNKKAFIILMIIATYCLITIPPIFAYGQPETLIFSLLFPGIGFSVLFRMLFEKTTISEKIFGIIWGLGFGGIPGVFMVLPSLLAEPIYLIAYIIGLGCILGMIICLKYLPKRTPYGNEMLGKIRGFKKFLETAEKQKLEAMVMENPTYFYDILPFTYVLDVSDKWIKKFESISLQAPSWYDSPNAFDMVSFGSFMNSTMESAESVMSSNPSSSSSSGGSDSSGGGSSGGGSGGGGGGSW